MARENVETVARLYDDFTRRNLPGEIERLDPDFEWRFDERSLQDTIQGRDNFLQFLADQIDLLDLKLEPDQLHEQGDQVIAIVRTRVRGQASGAEVVVRNAHIWTFEAGRALRVQGYAEPAKAFEAAGLTELNARVATAGDVDAVTATMTGAFYDDPLWSWAFPDPALRAGQHTVFWRLYVEGALPHGSVWVTDQCHSASVWIPPGCPELREEDEARLEPIIAELVGARSGLILEVFDRFEAAHPREQPHYYLSLLGTDPNHRGHGTGLALLAHNLARIDSEQMPAYLEASNPANVPLYERFGFVRNGEFALPDGGPTVATMWRDAHPVATGPR